MVQGWNLFLHSVLMILRNIPAILRIFLLPLLGVVVLILMIAYFNGQFAQTAIGDDSTLVDKRVDPKQMASVFLTMVMVLLLLFWGVVAWHRYVLLEETPRGWVPFFDRSIFGFYIWRVVLLAMVTLAFGVPFIFLFSAVAASIGMLGLVVMVMGLLAVFFIAGVFSLTLPAAAIGRPIRFGEAWKSTEGGRLPILVMLILSGVLQFALEFSVQFLAEIPLLGMVLAICVSLFLSMLSVSILTTLYGVYIEKRTI